MYWRHAKRKRVERCSPSCGTRLSCVASGGEDAVVFGFGDVGGVVSFLFWELDTTIYI